MSSPGRRDTSASNLPSSFIPLTVPNSAEEYKWGCPTNNDYEHISPKKAELDTLII